MTERKRQLLLLAVLLVVFAVVIGRQVAPRSGAAGIAAAALSRGSTASDRGATGAARSREVADLKLEALSRSAGRYSPGRDPFRFAPRPSTPPPKPDAEQQDLRRQARRAAEAARREAAQTQGAGPQPPPVDLIFLGSFGSRDRRLAVFYDGSDIFNALEGDVLKDKFIVMEIGFESADLGFVGFPDAPAERLAAGG